MLKTNLGAVNPIQGAVWFPGKKMDGFVVAPLSARALEIAKSREELLGLLRDLPESEHELSLTDLVEEGSTAAGSLVNKDTARREGELSRSMVIKERKKKRHSRSSFGSSSDGVLLNFYVPTSLARSITTPRSIGGGTWATATTDCNKRSLGCWSAFWGRGKKSRRQELQRMC
ncbi:hypothetical protein OPV22_010264 [Ensete ventricosum]|uniref:Uncharacterized protein n=1 Tax=Ensete ventricosum TaxID=4639 RepID=A0AAV8RL24_ENSVE|nr:hypothetical protein OPV22_010264 [Ensete ventricosum]